MNRGRIAADLNSARLSQMQVHGLMALFLETQRVIVQRGLRRLCAPAEMEGETISPSMPPPS